MDTSSSSAWEAPDVPAQAVAGSASRGQPTVDARECRSDTLRSAGDQGVSVGLGAPLGAWPLAAANVGARGYLSPTPS